MKNSKLKFHANGRAGKIKNRVRLDQNFKLLTVTYNFSLLIFNSRQRRVGFGLVETIVAVSIMLIISVTATTTILHAFSANRLGEEETKAALLAQEGIEATRSIKNQDFGNLTPGSYGLDLSGGSWVYSGTSDTQGKFTRQVVISQVQRDGDGVVVESGGVVDPDTWKAASIVSWSFSPTRNNSVELVTYLTNWEKAIGGDWADPSVLVSLDLPGSAGGNKLQVQGDYLYLVQKDTPLDFLVINVADPASPFIVGQTGVPGSANNIFVSGSYVYIASSSDDGELRIYDVADPASPTLVATYDAVGDFDGMGVYLEGSRVYLVKVDDGSFFRYEVVVLDVTTPSSPTLVGRRSLVGGINNEIVVLGNYGFIASGNDSAELRVIDVADPASWRWFDLSLVGKYDLPGNDDTQALAGFDQKLLAGVDGGGFYSFEVADPSNPELLGSYAASGHVKDVALDLEGSLAFLATHRLDGEFQVVDMASLSSLNGRGALDLPASLNGVAYHPEKNRVFAAAEDAEGELVVIGP